MQNDRVSILPSRAHHQCQPYDFYWLLDFREKFNTSLMFGQLCRTIMSAQLVMGAFRHEGVMSFSAVVVFYRAPSTIITAWRFANRNGASKCPRHPVNSFSLTILTTCCAGDASLTWHPRTFVHFTNEVLQL